jgi:hypothetical protein
MEIWVQDHAVVYGVLKALLASEIALSRLNRYMTKQELDLFKLASGLVAKPGASSTEIMWSDYADAAVCSRFTNDGPNYLCCKPLTLNLAGLAYGTEEGSVT